MRNPKHVDCKIVCLTKPDLKLLPFMFIYSIPRRLLIHHFTILHSVPLT